LRFSEAVGAGKGENRASADSTAPSGRSQRVSHSRRRKITLPHGFSARGLACSQHLPQHQADVERADVDQQTLQYILVSAQCAAPHSARFVAVGKAALDKFSPPSQQLFA